jgi:hypothetical protein
MNLKKINCLEATKHICGELDEHIDSPKCRAIRKHLESCPNCTTYLDTLKKTVLIYRNLPSPHAPARTRKSLFAALKLKT